MTTFNLGAAVLELRTSEKPLEQGLKDAKAKVSGELAKTQKDIDKVGSGFASSLGKFFTGAAVSFAVSALGTMVQKAREEEINIGRLAQAVDNAGVSWEQYGGRIEKVVASRQRFAFSDGQLRDSLTILTQMTGSVTRAVSLQSLAMDIARAKSISLAEASTLVGKVAGGNVGLLKRQGIAIREGATAQEALDLLQAKFAGNSERYANSAQASAERMANAWENVQEAIGGAIGGVLPVVSNVATAYAGLGHEVHIAVGALATFSKAGKGSIPILTGLKKGVMAIGLAMKSTLLSPVGLVIAAIAILVIGLKLLYDRSETFRKLVHKLGDALMQVFGPILKVGGAILGWLGDRLGDVGKALGIVGDEADENLGDDIPEGAAAAGQSIKTLGQQVADLRDKFKPAGVQSTEDFLRLLVGTDDAGIAAILDTIYDTVGADAQGRFRKITDQAYAQIQKEARDSIFAEAEAMAEIVKEGGVGLTQAAKEAGLTTSEFVDKAKQKTKEAEARLKLWTEGVVGAIQKARDLGQSELAAMDRTSAHISKVHELRDAWTQARDASGAYYSGVLAGGGVSGPPSRWDREDRHTPAAPVAGGDVGGVNLTLTQNIDGGGGTVQVAAAVQAATVDGVTEAYRQQARRLA